MRVGRVLGLMGLFLSLIVTFLWMLLDGSYQGGMGPVWNVGMAFLEIGFVAVVLFKELARENPWPITAAR